MAMIRLLSSQRTGRRGPLGDPHGIRDGRPRDGRWHGHVDRQIDRRDGGGHGPILCRSRRVRIVGRSRLDRRGDLCGLWPSGPAGKWGLPGWKLVAKRGTRKWADEQKAIAALTELGIDPYKKELLSPAQAEKKVKNLPEGLTVSVSPGDTLAPESDPRPAVLQIGQQLTAALSKLV